VETAFKAMLRQLAPPLDPSSRWEDIRERICKDEAFSAVILESERISIFNEYLTALEV